MAWECVEAREVVEVWECVEARKVVEVWECVEDVLEVRVVGALDLLRQLAFR